MGKQSVSEQAVLSSAIQIAATFHQDQFDKGGAPYILHVLRVMNSVKEYGYVVMTIAVLHDIVEDTPIELDDLQSFKYGQRVIDGVKALTKVDGESYENFIKRCSMNPDAKIVKRADLRDNSDITRLKGLRQKDFERLEKYSKAYTYLSD